jgi:RNA polymerase sigma-54 factor
MSKIVQKLEQKQKINPRQILESNLMQLNLSTLEKRILEEVESNPTLDIIEEESAHEEDEERDDSDFNWEDLISNPEDYNIKRTGDIFENTSNVEKVSLFDDFMFQLNDLSTTDKELEIAELILGNLDDRGYLTIEPILIADKINVDEEKVLKLIDKIKSLDPPGVGSRSLQECILSQLRAYYPKENLAINIIRNYFQQFKNHNYSQIIKSLKCTSNEINEVLKLIAVLNPSPASCYSSVDTEHILPDVIVEQVKEKWHVISNNSFIPTLGLNKNYKKMLNDKSTAGDAKKFLKQKIENASWFIDAISNRYETIVNIMYSIIKYQKSYFQSEERQLSPLVLKTIAQDIDMDISTISRATNGKFVQLPWGCFEIKSFFSEGIQTEDGDIVSNTVIKKEMNILIDNEDKKKPLTDSDLVIRLRDKKYHIARRTVTKYRELLKIPIARLRKKI